MRAPCKPVQISWIFLRRIKQKRKHCAVITGFLREFRQRSQAIQVLNAHPFNSNERSQKIASVVHMLRRTYRKSHLSFLIYLHCLSFSCLVVPVESRLQSSKHSAVLDSCRRSNDTQNRCTYAHLHMSSDFGPHLLCPASVLLCM